MEDLKEQISNKLEQIQVELKAISDFPDLLTYGQYKQVKQALEAFNNE